MEWAVGHNNVSREPYKQYTVCELDMTMSLNVRTCGRRENFVGVAGEHAIKTVYVVSCGPNGLFSEDEAYISVVRENYDMKRRVKDKKWKVGEMRKTRMARDEE